MTTLVVLSVIDIVLLIAGLAFYLYWAGTQLTRIAGNLEECAGIVRDDRRQRRADRAGRGAHQPDRRRGGRRAAAAVRDGRGDRHRRHPARRAGPPAARPARPASGRRRSRLHDAVGFTPPSGLRDGPGRASPEAGRAVSRSGSPGRVPVGAGRWSAAVYSPIHSSFHDWSYCCSLQPGLVDRDQLLGDLLAVRAGRRRAPRRCRCRPSTAPGPAHPAGGPRVAEREAFGATGRRSGRRR